MKKTLIEIFGWYGTIAIILAYGLVSFSVLPSNSIWYQILNGTGAIGILTDAFYKRDLQPAILNTIWAIVALIAIINIVK